MDIQIGSLLIVRSNYYKFFEVKTDYRLDFEEHVETACVKDHKKLTSLAAASPYMSVEEEDWLIFFSTNNSITVYLYDCSLAIAIIILHR